MKVSTLLFSFFILCAALLPQTASATIWDDILEECENNDSNNNGPSFGWIFLSDVHYNDVTAFDNDNGGQVSRDGAFLDQKISTSICINIPFFDYRSYICKSQRFCLEPELRLSVNNVVFEKSLSLYKHDDGSIWPAYTSDDDKFSKSKLCFTYLDLPIRIGFSPHQDKELACTLGIVPGLLINEHTKVKNPKEKDRLNCLNPFRLNAEMKVHISRYAFVYADYNLLPLFKDKTCLEAHAVTFGLGMSM